MSDEAFTISPSLLQSLRDVKQSIWFRIGTLHDDMKDNNAALAAFEKVLAHNPSNAAARAKAGVLLMKKECYQEAISYLHSSVSINPDNPPAWAALAHSYVMSDDLNNAYQAYHTALAKMPNHHDPSLWFGIGILYDRFGLLDNALGAFHAVLNMAPNFDRADEVYYAIGLIYKEQHKYELAHKYMTRVISTKMQQPTAYAEALYQIGHIYELAGNVSSALEAYHGAFSRNPNHVKCLQSLGWLTFKPGNVEEAGRYLGHASQLEPTDAYTFYLIGRIAMSTNDYRSAYDNYQQAVYRDGKNANFWCAIGILYFHMRQHRDAMDAYTRAIRINPQMPEVWYDMGTLYEVYQQYNDAVDAYRRVLQLQPSDTQASQRLSAVQHAVNNGVVPTKPTLLPRTDGPVVSPNPNSAARAHVRSDVSDRIGALPSPPQGPFNTPPTSSPEANFAPIPNGTSGRSHAVHMPIGKDTDRVAQQKLSPKLQPQFPRTTGAAGMRGATGVSSTAAQAIAPVSTGPANGIVADSTNYQPSSQKDMYSIGSSANALGKRNPVNPLSDDRVEHSNTGAPRGSGPEPSSQLSSFSKLQTPDQRFPGTTVARSQGSVGSPNRRKSSESLPRPVLQNPASDVRSTLSQPIHSAPVASDRPGFATQNRSGLSPPRSEPAARNEEPWRSSSYPSRNVHQTDSNRLPLGGRDHHVESKDFSPGSVTESPRMPGFRGSPPAPNGARESLPGPTGYTAGMDASRNRVAPEGAPSPTHPDRDGERLSPRQTRNFHGANGGVPMASSRHMTSEELSRRSTSSSQERRIPVVVEKEPTDSVARGARVSSGVENIRSEDGHGTMRDANSSTAIPTSHLPASRTQHVQNGAPQLPQGREDSQFDEAMLPRLRPLPVAKSAANGTPNGDSGKLNSPGRQGGTGAAISGVQGAIRSTPNTGSIDSPRKYDSRTGIYSGSSVGHAERSPRASPQASHGMETGDASAKGKQSGFHVPRSFGFRSVPMPPEVSSSEGVERLGRPPQEQIRNRSPSDRDGQINGSNPLPPTSYGALCSGPMERQCADSARNTAAVGSQAMNTRLGSEEKVVEQAPSSVRYPGYLNNRQYGDGKSSQPNGINGRTYGSDASPFRQNHIGTPEARSRYPSRVAQEANGDGRQMSTGHVNQPRYTGNMHGVSPPGSIGLDRQAPDSERVGRELPFGGGAPTSFSKSLSRAGASTGLTLSPSRATGNGKMQRSLPYDPKQISMTAVNVSMGMPNGDQGSPRGNKRRMSDIDVGGVRQEHEADNGRYSQGHGEMADKDGKSVVPEFRKPVNSLFSRVSGRDLSDDLSSKGRDVDDGRRAQKRIRSHNGMTEEPVTGRMSGERLKSLE